MTQLLSPQQHRFLLAVIEGKTYAEAFKAARFPAGCSDRAAQLGANRMIKDSALREALARAQAQAVEAAGLTVEKLVAQLMEARAIAFACDPPQVSAAVAATMGAGKLLGLVVDRSEVLLRRAKPSPVPVAQVELSESEWRRLFSPQANVTSNDR